LLLAVAVFVFAIFFLFFKLIIYNYYSTICVFCFKNGKFGRFIGNL
jgi:hypothetical protein